MYLVHRCYCEMPSTIDDITLHGQLYLRTSFFLRRLVILYLEVSKCWSNSISAGARLIFQMQAKIEQSPTTNSAPSKIKFQSRKTTRSLISLSLSPSEKSDPQNNSDLYWIPLTLSSCRRCFLGNHHVFLTSWKTSSKGFKNVPRIERKETFEYT